VEVADDYDYVTTVNELVTYLYLQQQYNPYSCKITIYKSNTQGIQGAKGDTGVIGPKGFINRIFFNFCSTH
jgi:hypothetical protein